MSEAKRYPVPESMADALLDADGYERLYQESVDDPDGFWSRMAREQLHWFSDDWKTVSEVDMPKGRVSWFAGGTLNASYNCLDRHLETRGDQTAILWEGDDPGESKAITYREAHAEVSRLANVLKDRGVKKGDRVCIYMPMIPEAAYAMLACARVGAIHSVVFGGFSPQAVRDRVLDADCRTIITADEGLRGGRKVPLKANVEKALEECPDVHTVLTVRRTGGDVPWQEGRDVWYHDTVPKASADCEAEPMDAEDPLFILYTSGSTGKPKGVQHATGGYLLQAALTHRYVFDYRDGEVYWCTADVGWVTGHSYIVYGPLGRRSCSTAPAPKA